MKFRGKAAILALAMFFILVTAGLATEKGFMWDGGHWKEMNNDLKVAYIKGVGNMADFETAAGGSSRAVCISKAFVDELKTKTVGQVVQEVDKYYKDNPQKQATPVIEVVMRSSTKLCPPEAPAVEKKK
jgi:hypothetical protein